MKSRSPNLKSQELSPAMMRLPPSPDVKSMANQMAVPDFSLDDDTLLHRGSISKNTATMGAVNNVGYHHHPQPQRRLRSVAKYNEFHPQALACSKNIVTTSYEDYLESSQDLSDPDSLGAIAGPRGVALFRLSRPHIPLLIFSHATNFLSAARNNSKSLNSISSLAFQPTISNNSTSNSNSLYLAAARGSGVLIWDASGHSPNPLLGRLQNDMTNDATVISDSRRDLENRITSMSWMSYCSKNASSTSPLLATTTASSLSIWDLRCRQSAILFKPGLRFGSSHNAKIFAASSSTPTAPLVQVACSSCSEECATIDISGTVRIYDLRKTDGGGRSSVGHPLSEFTAHNTGVGIDHLSVSQNGIVKSAWVTWGLETGMPSAIVKVWGSESFDYVNDSRCPSNAIVDKEEYWFMGDESQKSPPTKNEKYSIDNQDLSTALCNHQLIARYTRPNMCCARVCDAPVKNSLVVVGYSGNKSDRTSDITSEENCGWWAELLSLSLDTKSFLGDEKDKLSRECRGDFGLKHVTSFSGGAANTDVDKKSLMSVLGNSNIGSLQSAELAFSSINVLSNTTGAKVENVTKTNGSKDEARVELLLCCLSDTGVLTTTAIPEALPIASSSEVQRRDSSPQRHRQGTIIRTAFTSSNIHAGVFPDSKEGNSLIDVASIWGVDGSTRVDLDIIQDDEKIIEKSSSSSPLKNVISTEVSFRNDGFQQEGVSVPFDMEVPVPVAYNSVNTGNLNGVQSGMTEITPLSTVIDTTGDGIESKISTTSVMKKIDTDMVPCPRLCGAVFGSGNGRLAIFRNGEVKKMWNWYQRRSNIPGGQVDAKIPIDPEKQYQMTLNSGPRTLKELVDMVSAAKETAWGDANDASGVDEAMSAMDTFFEDDSLESNSDDSGNEIEDDDLMEDADELYKKYFGESSWEGFSERKTSLTENVQSTSSIHHHSIGPSSDMLQPIITVNVVGHENQNILLAKEWKLGRWKEGNMYSTIDLNLNSANISLNQHRQLRNDRRALQCANSIFSRAMSVPDGSSFQESMEELMTRYSHQQEGDAIDPTVLSPPLDSTILMNQSSSTPNHIDRTLRPQNPSSMRQKLDANQFQLSDSGVQNTYVKRHNSKGIYFVEFQEIYSLCLHNAEVSKKCDESEKESVWRLLAETALTQTNNSGKIFNGWGGNGGGALGIDMIEDFFLYYEARGDVQMLATMSCVLNGWFSQIKRTHHPSLLPRCREEVQNTYIIRYAELLYSWGLLNTRAELNKHHQRNYKQNEVNFQSTERVKSNPFNVGVAITCPTYGNEINLNFNRGLDARGFAFRCVICDTAVRGLFTFCQVCKHGGHLRHMVNWFSKNSFCPTGCGCQCKFSPVISSNAKM